MIHREFLPWDRPALPSAVRLLADEHDSDGRLDLERLVVVLPAARAGRRLLELLVQEAERRDLILLPPAATTIGALPERLHAPSRPPADEALAHRTWSRALRFLDPEARATVFPEPPVEDDLAGWDRIARRIHRVHREVAGEGLEFDDVAGVCREMGTGTEVGRWRILAAAQRAYHERLGDLGHVDRDAARMEALDAGDIETDREFWLVGVVEMPSVTRRMLEAAAAGKAAARDEASAPTTVTALIHAADDRSDAFDALGCVRTEVWKEAQIQVPDDVIVECGRPPSQADAAVRALSGEGRALAPDEIAVGVPNEEVIPHLEQRLEAYGVPHRYAAGTKLPATEPYRLLAAVADYLESRRFDDFAALLRHPRVHPRVRARVRAHVDGAASPLEVADRHFERRLPARLPRDPGSEAQVESDFSRLQRALHRALHLERLRGDATPAEWMPRVLNLLERAYGREPLERTTRTGRRLVETLETFRDAAASLRALPPDPDGVGETVSGAAAIRLLLAEVRDGSVPPLPDRGAVEMLGWLELHLDDAPVLVLTGFDDDHVPGAYDADLFLPGRLRSRLGLPDNDDRYARDAYLLSAILASREETHLIVGRRDTEGNPLRPSRLLLAERGEKLARRAERLFAEEEPSLPPLPRLGLRAEGESDFRSPPEPVLGIDEPPVDLRVTDFRLLLRDPYRWVLEREMRLRRRDDRARELEGPGFGSLAHGVLHAYGEEAISAPSSDPDVVRERLESHLDRIAAARFGPDVLPAVRLQVEQLRARLREFAAWQAERAAAGWKIVAAEIATPDDGVPLEVDGTAVRLHGRIDRIDRHPGAGRWAVLDYKSGENPKTPHDAHRDGRGEDAPWTDLQLPLYLHLLPALVSRDRERLAGLDDPDARVQLGYVNLSREGVNLAPADWTPDELAQADEAACEAVRTLRRGTFAFREDDFETYHQDPLGPLLGKGRLVAADVGPEEADGIEEEDGVDEGSRR